MRSKPSPTPPLPSPLALPPTYPPSRFLLVLHLVASYQFDTILSRPLAPHFNPCSNHYLLRRVYWDKNHKLTSKEKEEEEMGMLEWGTRARPGRRVNRGVWYEPGGGVGGMGGGRHVIEVEVVKDLRHRRLRHSLPFLSPTSPTTTPPIGFSPSLCFTHTHTPSSFTVSISCPASLRPSQTQNEVQTPSQNPEGCLFSLSGRMPCWEVEKCLRRSWEGEVSALDGWGVHRVGEDPGGKDEQSQSQSRLAGTSTLSSYSSSSFSTGNAGSQGSGNRHGANQHRKPPHLPRPETSLNPWGTVISPPSASSASSPSSPAQILSNPAQYFVKLQALHLMQQVCGDVERRAGVGVGVGGGEECEEEEDGGGSGSGVEFLGVYGRGRLVEPVAVLGVRRMEEGVDGKEKWVDEKKTIRLRVRVKVKRGLGRLRRWMLPAGGLSRGRDEGMIGRVGLSEKEKKMGT